MYLFQYRPFEAGNDKSKLETYRVMGGLHYVMFTLRNVYKYLWQNIMETEH